MTEFNNHKEYDDTNTSDDVKEVKEINDLWNESTTSVLNRECDEENDVDQKKNILDLITIGLFTISAVLFLLSYGKVRSGVFIFFALVIGSTTMEVIAPLNKYIKNGILQKNATLTKLILRVYIIILFITSLYYLLVSEQSNLKYSYWICFFCILVFFFKTLYDGIKNINKKRKVRGENFISLSFVGNILAVIFMFVFSSYQLAQVFITPQNEMYIDQIVVPESINIWENGIAENGERINDVIKQKTIYNQEVIQKIISNLEDKSYKTMTASEQFNYFKMRDLNAPYYNIYFENDGWIDEKGNEMFKKGDSIYLEVNANKEQVISIIRISNGIHLLRNYRELYPVDLSKDTIDMLFTYFNAIPE